MRSALPLATAVVSGVVYHLAQKASSAANVWPMLSVAYGAAFGLTLVLASTSGAPAGWALGAGGWLAGLLLGLAAFGIEASFFFLYRSGWPLASASVIGNVAVTAILAALGILVFGERLTLERGAGLALAVAGAVLVARGSGD
jgi:drug/metabolite transporter (DMT)-like permease